MWDRLCLQSKYKLTLSDKMFFILIGDKSNFVKNIALMMIIYISIWFLFCLTLFLIWPYFLKNADILLNKQNLIMKRQIKHK